MYILHNLIYNLNYEFSKKECKIKFINLKKNKILYHIRHLHESSDIESYKYPKWFVTEPNELLTVFIFRIWQNNDLDFKENDLNFYKKNLIVDIYKTQENVNLLEFFNQDNYLDIQNYILSLDKNYKMSNNNINIANWFDKNSSLINFDGWYEKKREDDKRPRAINEYMILPKSKNKLEYLFSESAESVIDFDNILSK